MAGWEKVIQAMKNCMDDIKCRDCPWEECEEFGHRMVHGVPYGLMENALNLLVAQEPVKPIFQKYAYCCGNCGENLARYFPPRGVETRFCPYCGRAVKGDG